MPTATSRMAFGLKPARLKPVSDRRLDARCSSTDRARGTISDQMVERSIRYREADMFSQQTAASADRFNGEPARLRSASVDSTEGVGASTALGTSKVRPAEALIAATIALAIYTALLLRLPYRSPGINSAYSVLALSAFYAYLKLRLKIRFPVSMLLCLVLSIVLDVVGNQFGLFSRRIALIPYDTITHFASSALSFIPVLWLLGALLERFDYRLPLGFVIFFSATTTFSLAAYYEITELIDERVFGGQRIWTPRDTVQDLAADLTGIIIAAACCSAFIRHRRRNQT